MGVKVHFTPLTQDNYTHWQAFFKLWLLMGVKLDKATLAGHGTPIGRPSAICLSMKLPMGVKDHFIPL